MSASQSRTLCLLLVVLAAALNAAAPALGYATGQFLHDLDPGHTVHAHGASHGEDCDDLATDRAAHNHPAQSGASHSENRTPAKPAATPHCLYCPGFAGSAPLAWSPPMLPGLAIVAAFPLVQVFPAPSARPFVRISSPRGPPPSA
jgi:hypothetical protein